MQHKISLSLFLALAVLCLAFLSPANAYIFSPDAPPSGTSGSIYLSYNGTQSQGNVLAVDVRANTISASAPAIGAAFDLDFDPSVLTYISYSPGSFFVTSDIPGNGTVVTLTAIQQGMPGKLLIGISQNNGDPGASGSGVLLTLKFSVASGNQILQSGLSFSNMSLIDPQGQPVAGSTWYNGHVVQYPLEIVTASLPQGTQGNNMTLPLNASGGFTPYTWSKTAGNFAPGLSLNTSTGVISGVPSESGIYPVTIRLTDASSQVISRDFNMVINPLLQLLTSSLAGTTVSQAYNQALSATGGTAPLTWDVSSGALPSGILLNNTTGVLSGTPSVPGVFPFTVRARDANGASVSRSLSITVYQGLTIATTSLPETTAGAAYNSTIQVQGGSAPYTWTITSGLPTGLSLIPDTGTIIGITSTAGSWGFTVTVKDTYGASATKGLAILVNPLPSIVTTSVSNLYQDSTGQGVTLSATGGVSPYTWNLLSGALPAGLTLDTQSGVVSGTPSKPGKYIFTIRVTDAVGVASSTEYQWIILATPPGNVDFVTPGSVNRVDGYDLIALDLALYTTINSQRWNPFADFNGDEKIDDADFLILQEHFGQSNGH